MITGRSEFFFFFFFTLTWLTCTCTNGNFENHLRRTVLNTHPGRGWTGYNVTYKRTFRYSGFHGVGVGVKNHLVQHTCPQDQVICCSSVLHTCPRHCSIIKAFSLSSWVIWRNKMFNERLKQGEGAEKGNEDENWKWTFGRNQKHVSATGLVNKHSCKEALAISKKWEPKRSEMFQHAPMCL